MITECFIWMKVVCCKVVNYWLELFLSVQLLVYIQFCPVTVQSHYISTFSSSSAIYFIYGQSEAEQNFNVSGCYIFIKFFLPWKAMCPSILYLRIPFWATQGINLQFEALLWILVPQPGLSSLTITFALLHFKQIDF